LSRYCLLCQGNNRDEAYYCRECGGGLLVSQTNASVLTNAREELWSLSKTKARAFRTGMNKPQLIALLKKYGISDTISLEHPEVNEENFVFALRKERYELSENFFRELAKELKLPFVAKEQLENGCDLSIVLPYRLLKENLVLPMDVSTDKVKIATSNPLNRAFFQVLESIFGNKKFELYVASTEVIEKSIEQGYKGLHRDRALLDLYYRRPDESAHQVLYPWQSYTLAGLSVFSAFLFLINYPLSFVFVFSVINVFYFLVNPVKFYISLKGFTGSKRAIHVSNDEVEKLEEKNLPIYTILVPVYGETEVLPHILQNIYKMDYPKEKLDVKILMEEKDKETLREASRLGLFGNPETIIEPMDIHQYREFLKTFDAVVVPDAKITTKPRACNFGLLRAKGEYCVIYDAEDDPEPDQLKKAVLAFSRFDKNLVCLQSRLNFYNPKENLLTRWFSLEYSYWYEYYLEGLDQVGAPLPLGGTSNHFRTKQLRELGGWDPYNMTEDADLGVRISRRKMKTAMLNSYTYEEANRKLGNWIRQRSRWIKGYIQTYLVHMRRPRQLVKDMGWKQFLFFQLTFGANIYMPLINPLFWMVTVLTFLIPGIFRFLFFYPIIYICIFNMVIGNLVYISLHLWPPVLRRNYASMALALAIPLYWILISIGAWKGAIQLITKPFYWEKTQHGLSEIHKKA